MIEYHYLANLELILKHGTVVEDERTGVGTIAMTNVMLEQEDVTEWFPILTSKRVPWKPVIGELLWFLEGSCDDQRLAEITFGDKSRETIWTANAQAPYWKHKARFDGDLGRVYGVQWRSWKQHVFTMDGFRTKNIDQLRDLINRAKSNPSDRRLIVTAWNPAELDMMALPPCHLLFQVNILDGNLDLLMVQRSADMFLGVPFNIASYAALMHILGRELNVRPRKLSIVLGNAHIYKNHVDQVNELLSRRKEIGALPTPTLSINNDAQLFNDDGTIGYKVSDFVLNDYEPLSTIKAPMAV